MKKETKKLNSGFVILFAVMISSILLAIALGVQNIALKEIKFGTSAKDTNDAFFAADTGVECALFNDKSGGDSFVEGGFFVHCLGHDWILNNPPLPSYPPWIFVINGMGSNGKSCAIVSVAKDTSNPESVTTTIISKGYNTGNDYCNYDNVNRIERELQVTY